MRRRRSPPSTAAPESDSSLDDELAKEDRSHDNKQRTNFAGEASFFVARWLILRLLGLVYLMAFLGAYWQNEGLIGSHGLQPASAYFEALQRRGHHFRTHPTLFWWLPLTDSNLDLMAISGILLSCLLVSKMLDSAVLLLLLWVVDFSIVTVAGGTSFYSYGWESQLLETGFLAIFLCCTWRPNRAVSPSPVVLWLFRWLCFRISMGAGLIKLRGSTCWKLKTCLHYHFETQPIPSPLSFLFHFLPKSVLSRAVDLDLFVQVYTSWFVLVPVALLRRLGGFIQAGFMINILLSGNFAFLNHLTIIPALACIDDACWPKWLQTWSSVPPIVMRKQPHIFRKAANFGLLLLIGALSVPVVANLVQWDGGRQQMNASFGSFRLVNTYGAFGSVGEARYEPILSISHNGRDWIELEFPCKPGNVTRRPCFSAPYHYRLDWNIWFIGFKPHRAYLNQREQWLYRLLQKILNTNENPKQQPWLDLLDTSARKRLEQVVPRYAKVDMYRYEMAAPLWNLLLDYVRDNKVTWWKRQFEEELIPPVELDELGTRLRQARLDNDTSSAQ